MTPNQLPPMPEPDGQMTVTFGIDEKRKVPVFFGGKLTDYALSALAQQAQEPVYQLQVKDGRWIDQSESQYNYNKAHESNVMRILYTTPQPQPAPPVPDLTDEQREAENLKAMHDLMLYGTGITVGGKHVPLESVVIRGNVKPVPAPVDELAYFSYSADSDYIEHATEEAAREQAETDLRTYRGDAMHDNEWPDEVESVCWGVVLQKTKAVDNSEEAGQPRFDYELAPALQSTAPQTKGGEA